MNAFHNHTSTTVQHVGAAPLIASLTGELKAADAILDTVRPFLNLSQLLHIRIDLQQRGVVDQNALRAPERKAVLAMAGAYQPTFSATLEKSRDLVRRLRTVAGQTTIKPPALDPEAADHIDQLERQLAALAHLI
jgi:hypothetical protein